MCLGTGAVPVAAAGGGEAQMHSPAVNNGSSKEIVISKETCCDGIKNILHIEFPLRNGMRALLTELTYGVPSIKRYYWSQFLVLVIIALLSKRPC